MGMRCLRRGGGLALAWLSLSALKVCARDLPQPRDVLPDVRDRELPGWNGEQPNEEDNEMIIQFTSWTNPYVILHIKNFLSREEYEHIKAVAKPKMARSTVVDHASTASVVDEYRTSTGTFLSPGMDPTISTIEHRLAQLVMLPVENQEAMQVLHYGIGEKYGAHMDAFFDPRLSSPEQGGERIATALMFLSTPEEGGETVFPNMPGINPAEEGWSECARRGLAVKPRAGDMVLFYSLFPNGTVDPMSTHTACPVIKGEKWSAPKWIHTGNFQHEHRTAPAIDLSQLCTDLSVNCRDWAAKGECEKNQPFMVGTEVQPGQCRESCGTCPYPKLTGGAAKAPQPKVMSESIVRGGADKD